MKYININFTSYLFLNMATRKCKHYVCDLHLWLTFCFCWGMLLLRALLVIMAMIKFNGDAPLFTLAQARTALTCGMAGMSKSQCTESQGHAARAGTQRVLSMKQGF